MLITMSNAILTVIKTAIRIPPLVIFILHTSTSTMPVFTYAICKSEVIITIKSMGRSPFNTVLTGILETAITIQAVIRQKSSPTKLFDTKVITIYTVANKSFVLGSKRCMGEFIGKYCPMVISFIIQYPFPQKGA